MERSNHTAETGRGESQVRDFHTIEKDRYSFNLLCWFGTFINCFYSIKSYKSVTTLSKITHSITLSHNLVKLNVENYEKSQAQRTVNR